jgi:Rap1a immunity proteins
MKSFFVAVLLSASLGLQPAQRKVTLSDIDGAGLLDFCSKPEGTALQFCEAFILGVRDGVVLTAELRDSKPLIDTPFEAKQHQLRAVVVKYLNDHPEEQHKPAGLLVIFALSRAFPPEDKARK